MKTPKILIMRSRMIGKTSLFLKKYRSVKLFNLALMNRMEMNLMEKNRLIGSF